MSEELDAEYAGSWPEAMAKSETGKRYIAQQREIDLLLETFVPGVHFSRGENNKLVLLQPGAQRIAQYFGWTMQANKDLDYTPLRKDELYPGPLNGVVTATVELNEYIKDDENPNAYVHTRAVGEGFGAAHVTEWADKGPLSWNIALKMALKRAYVCAVIYAAGISDRFSQDVPPDMDETPPAKIAVQGDPPVPEGRTYGARGAR